MTSSTFRHTFAAAGLAAGIALAPAASDAADLGAVDEPIRLAIHEWTGQHLTTRLIGETLKEMGYTVEYITAGYLSVPVALADGEIAGSLEVWDNNLGDMFPNMLSEGSLSDLGDVGLDAGEGWAYPAHVADACPGLPAWDAFKDCAQVFATGDTFPKGRFLEYPADWGDRGAQLISGEGLNFAPVPAGSEGALVAELKASAETGDPLIMMFWTPHWVMSEVDVKWVDIPDDLRETYSIQIPRVFKVVWPGMQDKWPAAYEVIKAAQVTNGIQEPMMAAIDRDGADTEEVITAWMAENEEVWRGWMTAAN